MTATTSSIRSTINDLIATCKDGQEGFRAAAEHVEDAAVKTVLNKYSLERAHFAGDLQAAATGLGDSDPQESGSVAGAVHRGWINLKGALMGRDTYQILAECEAGEDSAVKAYRTALEVELPGDVKELVSSQAVKVKAAHDAVKALRDAAKK